MTMNLSWLEDFQALAESGNFSRAAEQRHMTQPAFSRRVRALEEWLGVALFDRSTQRVYLAQTGLVTTQPGVSLPNHFTVMRALPGERTLADGTVRTAVDLDAVRAAARQLSAQGCEALPGSSSRSMAVSAMRVRG